jgi:hypothetical protein
MGEPFQNFLVGPASTPTTVDAMMLIENLGEELVGGGFADGVGGSPDLLSVPLETPPICRVALVGGCQRPAPASVLDVHETRAKSDFCNQDEPLGCALNDRHLHQQPIRPFRRCRVAGCRRHLDGRIAPQPEGTGGWDAASPHFSYHCGMMAKGIVVPRTEPAPARV